MSQSQKTIKSTFLLLTELSRSKTEKVARLRRLAVDVGEEKAEEGKRHGVGAGPADGSVGRSENGRAWTALIIGSDLDDLQGSENRIEAKRREQKYPSPFGERRRTRIHTRCVREGVSILRSSRDALSTSAYPKRIR